MSILLWQPSPWQTIATKVQPPAIAVIQSATSFNKCGLRMPCPLHHQIPLQTISTASSSSPTVRFYPNIWCQRIWMIYRLITVENFTFFISISRFRLIYNFWLYNLLNCYCSTPRQSFQHRPPRPVLPPIPHFMEAPPWLEMFIEYLKRFETHMSVNSIPEVKAAQVFCIYIRYQAELLSLLILLIDLDPFYLLSRLALSLRYCIVAVLLVNIVVVLLVLRLLSSNEYEHCCLCSLFSLLYLPLSLH